MTYTRPCIKYAAIRTKNGTFYNVIRTRDTWNTITGEFVAYDNQVIDILDSYHCLHCDNTELLWDSQFDSANDYRINCDYCGIPLSPLSNVIRK